MEKIINMNLSDYIDILSSESSMPGGGTVSAIDAVMGVSLYLMVINLSLNKEKFQNYKQDLLNYKNELIDIKNNLISLIDEDVTSFNSMIDVYKMKTETNEEKAYKEVKKQEALSICIIPPIKIMQYSLAAIPYINKLIGKTIKSAESDLIIGSMNLKTAIHTSYQNVLVNLKYMTDIESVESFKRYTKAIVEKSKNISKEIKEMLLNGY